MPISKGPVAVVVLKFSSSITESQQINNSPGVGIVTLDGRNGTLLASTVEVPVSTFTLKIELEGSRCGTRMKSCAASAQVRKNGAVSPLTRVVRPAVLILMTLTLPTSGPVVCSLTYAYCRSELNT